MLIKLKYCTLEYTPGGARTVFDDGSVAGAFPHPNLPHYYVASHRAGYGDDLLHYCREHEFVHHFIAQELWDKRSDVIYAVARDAPLSGPKSAAEEALVAVFQRWLRANEEPLISDIPWQELKVKAILILCGSEYYGSTTTLQRSN